MTTTAKVAAKTEATTAEVETTPNMATVAEPDTVSEVATTAEVKTTPEVATISEVATIVEVATIAEVLATAEVATTAEVAPSAKVMTSAEVVSTDEQSAPRYSYLEIKEAQHVCSDKMNAAALKECGSVSTAQQQIFRAHVNDLCATVFAAALRKYNPEDREEVGPVDKETTAKLKELESKLKKKEAAVKKLRERVPRMAAANARRELAKARKRHVNVLVAEPEVTADISAELTEEQVEALKAAYVKTASSIAVTSAKLSQAMSHTTETISIVEQAMKRPKTDVDIAMENSPLKAKALLDEEELDSFQKPSPLRTRLALQLSAPKNV